MAKTNKKISKKSKKKGLSPKNQRFVEEYVKTGNATQAYLNSGYSENGAGQKAYVLLKKHEILKAIEERRLEIAERNNVTADRIIQEYAKMAFLDSSDVFDYQEQEITILNDEGEPETIVKTIPVLKPHKELSKSATASIQSIEDTKHGIKIKLYDKQKALESLGRYIGVDNEAQIDKAKRIKEHEKNKEVVDPLEGMTSEQIKADIERFKNG